MSDNKMGGVPSKTREALYRFFRKQNHSEDEIWARVIDKMTELGPQKSLDKLKS